MSTPAKPQIQAFFDEPTNTVSYLVWDAATMEGAVIDPVLDYDHRSGKASTRSADRVLATAREQDLAIAWILETHAHADHLSAAPYLKQRTGAQVAVIFGDDEAREGSASLKPLREDVPQRRVPLDQLADEIGNFLFGDDKNGDL